MDFFAPPKNIHYIFMRQPNPERGYLWTFKKNNLWTFMTHWWTFLTKKTKIFLTQKQFVLPIIYYVNQRAPYFISM